MINCWKRNVCARSQICSTDISGKAPESLCIPPYEIGHHLNITHNHYRFQRRKFNFFTPFPTFISFAPRWLGANCFVACCSLLAIVPGDNFRTVRTVFPHAQNSGETLLGSPEVEIGICFAIFHLSLPPWTSSPNFLQKRFLIIFL